MKLQVPQFIEVEDKLFWNLTLRQFIYLTGGGGLSIMIYLLVPIKFLAIILCAPIVGFSLALAFYKYNNRPFIVVVEAATKYMFNSRLYIWKKVDNPVPQSAAVEQDTLGASFVPKLSDSKLKEMNWSLDVKKNN
jgi:hypothetical protein